MYQRVFYLPVWITTQSIASIKLNVAKQTSDKWTSGGETHISNTLIEKVCEAE